MIPLPKCHSLFLFRIPTSTKKSFTTHHYQPPYHLTNNATNEPTAPSWLSSSCCCVYPDCHRSTCKNTIQITPNIETIQLASLHQQIIIKDPLNQNYFVHFRVLLNGPWILPWIHVVCFICQV
jgi:hypothetical protein